MVIKTSWVGRLETPVVEQPKKPRRAYSTLLDPSAHLDEPQTARQLAEHLNYNIHYISERLNEQLAEGKVKMRLVKPPKRPPTAVWERA